MITQSQKDNFIKTITDYDAFWLTMYGEARGEPVESQIGVGNTIMNRMREGHKPTLKEVCLAPLQFSCWNLTDPNLASIVEAFNSMSAIRDQIMYLALGISKEKILDNTKGSNHYLTTKLYRSNECPKWAAIVKPNAILGNHTFLWCP